MFGKGVICLIGGVLVFAVTFFKRCNDSKGPLESKDGFWIRQRFIYPSLRLDSPLRAQYYSRFSLSDEKASLVAAYINMRSRGGIIVRDMEKNEYKYLNKRGDFIWISDDSGGLSYYYIVSLDTSDFILGIRDTSLLAVVSVDK